MRAQEILAPGRRGRAQLDVIVEPVWPPSGRVSAPDPPVGPRGPISKCRDRGDDGGLFAGRNRDFGRNRRRMRVDGDPCRDAIDRAAAAEPQKANELVIATLHRA